VRGSQPLRVLITGASSLPGYRAALALLSRGHQVVGTYLTHEVPIQHEAFTAVRLDVRDRIGLERLFKKHRPEAVIHMAAYGDVDGCERDRALAWDVNVLGTINVVRAAERYADYLLYLSTDYVFDGLRGMYEEHEPPCPINYYGLTKMCGEVAVLTADIGRSIVRASSIYGLGPGRKNFAKFLVENLSAGKPVRALVDQYTTPTQASLLAEALVEILERRPTGIFHVVGERMSRHEFALRIAEFLGLNKELVKKAEMEEFSWLAPRPRDASLRCERTRQVLKTDFYSTSEALRALRTEYEEVRRRP